MTDGPWPRLIEENERVQVEFDGFLVFDRHEWGTVVEVDLSDPDDPQYLVRLDRAHPDVPGLGVNDTLHPEETWSIRWFAWEFVRPLTLLEQIADAAR